MKYRVIFTERAERELEQAAEWWAEHRSVDQARRWYAGFSDVIASLAQNPERCPFAPENGRFPYDIREPARMREILELFTGFLGQARAIRRLGSAAIDLCWVAAGRMDGFWEQALQPWDIMGGALIVQEAGGRVTNLDGSPWDAHRGNVLASNAHLHEEMLRVVRSVR